MQKCCDQVMLYMAHTAALATTFDGAALNAQVLAAKSDSDWAVGHSTSGYVLTLAGAAVGMEYYARYAHKYLWHESLWTMPLKTRKEWNRPIWLLHESHHLPREGAFEANDIFAIANGVPAFALCAYGFLTPGVFGGLCFGAGLGITFFGIAYMYVHDGMVHKRFPTGPLGKLPFLRKIAAGHTIHHTEAFAGVPWGLFLFAFTVFPALVILGSKAMEMAGMSKPPAPPEP